MELVGKVPRLTAPEPVQPDPLPPAPLPQAPLAPTPPPAGLIEIALGSVKNLGRYAASWVAGLPKRPSSTAALT